MALVTEVTDRSFAQTQSEINGNACNRLKKADAELNHVYQQVLVAKATDADFLKAFRQAQRAWIPIWQLAKLDNIDKHRYLAIYETALDMRFPHLRETDDVVRNAEAGEITLPLEHSKTEMLLNPKPAVWFGAEAEDLKVNADRLREIYSYIRMQVLPLFAPLFIRAIA